MEILRLLVLFNFDIPLYRSSLAVSFADSRFESSNCSSRLLQDVFALCSRWPAFSKSLDFSVKPSVSCRFVFSDNDLPGQDIAAGGRMHVPENAKMILNAYYHPQLYRQNVYSA